MTPKLPRKRTALPWILLVVVLFLAALAASVFFLPLYESIEVRYVGSTAAGVELSGENDGILVTGIDRSGNQKSVPSWKWTIDYPAVLEPDHTTSVYIRCRGLFAKLTVPCSTSLVRSISASYDGPTGENVSISPDSEGLHVIAAYTDGGSKDVTKACSIDGGSVTLEKDKISALTISYTDPYDQAMYSCRLDVKCSTRTVISISAEYRGSSADGVVLDDDNKGIVVTAVYPDNSEETVSGWHVSEPAALVTDGSADVTIWYEDQSCTLTVECSTISESSYKKSCTAVRYSQLLKNPDDWRGKRVRISGSIMQIISEGSGYLNVYKYLVTVSGSSNNVIYVTYVGYSDSVPQLGSSVTVYGVAEGLFSYDTVAGTTNTVPEIHAEYMK